MAQTLVKAEIDKLIERLPDLHPNEVRVYAVGPIRSVTVIGRLIANSHVLIGEQDGVLDLKHPIMVIMDGSSQPQAVKALSETGYIPVEPIDIAVRATRK